MKICENCGAQKETTVCFLCGAAFYDDPKAVVRIIATNYTLEEREERSRVFWAPLIKGVLQRIHAETAAK